MSLSGLDKGLLGCRPRTQACMPGGAPPMWSSLRSCQPTWTGQARMCEASNGRHRCPRTTHPPWTCTDHPWEEQLPQQLLRQPPLPASPPLVTEPASPSAGCPRLLPPPCAPAYRASRCGSFVALHCRGGEGGRGSCFSASVLDTFVRNPTSEATC